MAIDLSNYTPLGDKKNSDFFEEYLPKVYERRAATGLDEIVREMAAVVIQVEHGDADQLPRRARRHGPVPADRLAPHRHATACSSCSRSPSSRA